MLAAVGDALAPVESAGGGDEEEEEVMATGLGRGRRSVWLRRHPG